MQRIWALSAIVAVAASSAVEAKSGYQPRGLLRSGYSERALGPGEWTVRGSSREAGASVGVALYRAAELATQAGVTELRITRQKIKSTTVSDRSYRQISYTEATDVTVRAVRTAQDRTLCDMPDLAKCMTLPVAGIMATYGPRMAVAAALPGAAPAPPLTLVTTSAHSRAVADLLARNPQMRATAASAAPSAWRGTAVAASGSYSQAPGAMRSRASSPSPAELLAARLKAAQPVRGGDPAQGWTISD